MNLEELKVTPSADPTPSIEVSEVGALASTKDGTFQIAFGVYLPGIRAADGFRREVRVIHADDRFDPDIQTNDQNLEWEAGRA